MSVDFSVVIPTFNRWPFLKETLSSLIQQNLDKSRYEIIVVDDGSTDETEREIKNYPVKYIQQKNLGPAQARNTGARAASGKIIAFIDSDALADKSWLANAFRYFRNPDTAILEGKTINPSKEPLSLFSHTFENLKGGLYQTCNMFFRRDVFFSAGGFDPAFGKEYFFREDSDLIFTLMEKGSDPIPFAEDVVVYHPPRLEKPNTIINRAKRYQWDSLLFKKHPALYRKYFGGVIDGHTLFVLLFVLGSIISLASGKFSAAGFFLCLLVIAYIVETTKRAAGKKFTIGELAIFICYSLPVPFVKFLYLMKGNIINRTFLW